MHNNEKFLSKNLGTEEHMGSLGIIIIIIIQRMWNVKAKMVPVILGATAAISKSLRKYLNNTPRKKEITELKKQPYWALHTYCGKC
jgi:hypothetical protein